MACQDIGSGMFWNGSGYFSDAACTVPIGGSLDTLTQEQILNGIDYEAPSKQENIDWLKWLQGSSAKSSATGSSAAGKRTFGAAGIILVGAGVFVLVLVLFGLFNKK